MGWSCWLSIDLKCIMASCQLTTATLIKLNLIAQIVPTNPQVTHKSKEFEITSIFGKMKYFPKKSTIILRSMAKNMRFLDPAYLFWAIVWNKWNPLFSGAKIENLNKNLDPGHVFVFSGSKKYFPQHYHSSLQNIDILQRHVNFAPFQKNHFQGYLYFKCALMSNANPYMHS